MRERYDRLHPMSQQVVKDSVVKREPRLIGLGIIAVGKDTRPIDRHPKTGKSHLRIEFDILVEAVIRIDCLVARVVFTRMHRIVDLARHPVASTFFYIGD